MIDGSKSKTLRWFCKIFGESLRKIRECESVLQLASPPWSWKNVKEIIEKSCAKQGKDDTNNHYRGLGTRKLNFILLQLFLIYLLVLYLILFSGIDRLTFLIWAFNIWRAIFFWVMTVYSFQWSRGWNLFLETKQVITWNLITSPLLHRHWIRITFLPVITESPRNWRFPRLHEWPTFKFHIIAISSQIPVGSC